MANGFWDLVSRLLQPSGQGARPRPSRKRAASGAGRVSTRTWGRGGPGKQGGQGGQGGAAGESTGAPARPTTGPAPTPAGPSPSYPGDFTGRATLSYTPVNDGWPDPGEVVWAWVPFEEDHTQGKDRPVLVIARHGGRLLGLMLTSKDHDRDAAQEARFGRHWIDVGTGAWDRQGRPSEVRVDRVLQLESDAVRREGATLERSRYEQVASAVREAKGW